MKLKRYRRLHELTTEAFASKLGVSSAAYSRYESGQVMPPPAVLSRIRDITNGRVTADDLLDSLQMDSD